MKNNLGINLVVVLLVLLGFTGLILKNNFIPLKDKNGNIVTDENGNPKKADLIRQGLDLKGGAYVVLKAMPTTVDKTEEEKKFDEKLKAEGKEITPEKFIPIDEETMNNLRDAMERRVNLLGTEEIPVQRSGVDRLIIEIPGVKDTEKAIETIGKTALLEFKIVKSDGTLGSTLLSGKDLESSSLSSDRFGRPAISFKFKNYAAKKFAKITRENVGKQLAITLDGKKQTSPTINGEIPNGNGIITGQYTLEQAKETVALLNAGALPVKVEVLETRTVGATLGAESIAKSKKAGMWAVIIIMVFMVVWYRVPGLVANVALLFFGITAFGSLNFFDAVLTLPGIAGFILSMGMAVDANVIIFERIKEELRNGNSIMASIDAGFSKAFVAIFDSNITTLLITAILFSMGTGPVKGFAITLTIGILSSMFTAIVVTKVLLKIFVQVLNVKSPVLFGVRGEA